MIFKAFFTTLFLCFLIFNYVQCRVSLSVNGLKAQIKNDIVELNFNENAYVTTLLVYGRNIAATGQRTFSLDWNAGGQGFFKPSSIHIVEQSNNRVHFYWLQDSISNFFNIEYHIIMVDGLAGVYQYAKYINARGTTLATGETRIIYRFDHKILTQGTNSVRYGTIPTSADLNAATTVQDSTWRFANGTYFSKYDYSEYIRDIFWQGLYGNGYGAFVISPSREYHGGGPMKQDLTVHQESLIANYFMSGHFGTLEGLTAPAGWRHIYGPFLVYFPTGNDGQILNAVKNQLATEQNNWPYAWMADNDYPRTRGSVSGIVSGQKSATVVVWDSDEDFDIQQRGYLYSTNTDPSSGYYMIKNVRPGNYRVAAYPLAGHGSDQVAQGTVTVTAGNTAHLGLTLNEPSNIMWSIGQANRRSSEFKYSDQPRNYEWEGKPPSDLTFSVGSSNEKEEWYYAQSKKGTWTIKYQDSQNGNSRTLRVALAAGSAKPHLQVLVNGHRVGNLYFDNDSAVYRSAMQSGKYHSNVLTVSNAQVVNGENTIQLIISIGQVMYDVISMEKH